jgi:hypothetical protein
VRQRVHDNPFVNDVEEDQGVDVLGRSSVSEVIERGRNSGGFVRVHVLLILILIVRFTGAVNLSARSLSCLPPSLFEVHLGITPDPLKSAIINHDDETLPTHTVAKPSKASTPWFAAQDLTTLKAFTNDIVEIQHEISLFGSLKVVDVCIDLTVY